jgi:transcriptional regulator with XRE-family HTH domain
MVYIADMASVGERLRNRREQARLTLGQVGEYEHLSAQYLSRLERGVNDPGVWDLLARLAKRYNTSTDYLLGLTDDPRPLTALQAVSEEKAEYRTHNTESINEAQRAVLDFFDSLSEEEQDFVFGLIHLVQQRNTPRIIE